MFTDLELMDIQVRALFTSDAESRLLLVNEPSNVVAPAPRFFLGRTPAGNVMRFRADLTEELVQELKMLCADEPFLQTEFDEPPRHVERYVQLLEEYTPVESVSAGPAYYFSENTLPSRQPVVVTESNREVLKGGFENLVEELLLWQPFVALIEGGRAVSVCRSVRITAEAHEAGVETLPDYRRKGYAKDVVAEWAQRVRAIGALPLYSTSWDNKASQAVARSLRLKFYGADFHMS